MDQTDRHCPHQVVLTYEFAAFICCHCGSRNAVLEQREPPPGHGPFYPIQPRYLVLQGWIRERCKSRSDMRLVETV